MTYRDISNHESAGVGLSDFISPSQAMEFENGLKLLSDEADKIAKKTKDSQFISAHKTAKVLSAFSESMRQTSQMFGQMVIETI